MVQALVFCYFGLARAQVPHTSKNKVSREQLAAELTAPAWSWDEIRGMFGLVSIGPGALAPERVVIDHEVESVRTIGAQLHEKLGLTLVLLSHWNGLPIPGFDGLVLDDTGRVIANFSLKQKMVMKSTKELKKHADRLPEFSRTKGWVDVFLAPVRYKSTSRDPQTRQKTTRYKIAEYRRRLAPYQVLHRLFVTDPPRATWLIIDYVGTDQAGGQGVTIHREYTRDQAHLYLLAHVKGRLTTFCQGELVRNVNLLSPRSP